MALMQIPRKLTTASRDAFSVSQPKSIQSFDSVSLERKIYVAYLATDAFNVF